MMKGILMALASISIVMVSARNIDPEPRDLKLVAHADGKDFFAQSSSPFLNWVQAGEYCVQHGLQLASVTSAVQFEALKSAARNGKLIHAHWTAGRDAHLPRQFSWNTTNTEVSSDLGFAFVGVDNHKGYQSCLVFMGYTSNNSNLDWRVCTNLHRILCETKLILPN